MNDKPTYAELEARIKELSQDVEKLTKSKKLLVDTEWMFQINNQIAKAFLTMPDDQMYSKVIDVVQKQLESQIGYFGYIDEAGDLVKPSVLVPHIWDNCDVAGKSVVYQRSDWKDTNNTKTINEKKTYFSNKPSEGIPSGHIPLQKYIVTPIIHQDKVIGILSVANRERDYDENDIQILENIAGYIAPVLACRLERNIQRKGRQKAEDALSKLMFMNDNANEGYLLVDKDARLIYVNKAACKFLGYTEEELLKLTVPDVDIVFDLKKYKELFKQVQIDPPIVETINKRKDGSTFPSEIRLSCLKIDGESYLFATLRDITDRRKVEQEMKKAMTELARSNADLQQFAYVVSHDLQEPLRMMRCFSELLAKSYKGQLNEKADTFIEYIVDGATRMQELINGLLTYSRLGREGMPVIPVNMNEIFNQVLKSMQQVITENNSEITSDSLPTIKVSAVHVKQLLQNLIENAMKFRSNRSPLIHLSAVQRDREWLFSLQDNGIGIEPEYTERIFSIFQRLHNREEYPGTGIGLAVCKKIVELYAGRIWVESEVGKGSVFYFTFPV